MKDRTFYVYVKGRLVGRLSYKNGWCYYDDYRLNETATDLDMRDLEEAQETLID